MRLGRVIYVYRFGIYACPFVYIFMNKVFFIMLCLKYPLSCKTKYPKHY